MHITERDRPTNIQEDRQSERQTCRCLKHVFGHFAWPSNSYIIVIWALRLMTGKYVVKIDLFIVVFF